MRCDVCGVDSDVLEPEAETEAGMARVIEEHKRILNCHFCEACHAPVQGWGHFEPRGMSYSCKEKR